MDHLLLHWQEDCFLYHYLLCIVDVSEYIRNVWKKEGRENLSIFVLCSQYDGKEIISHLTLKKLNVTLKTIFLCSLWD